MQGKRNADAGTEDEVVRLYRDGLATREVARLTRRSKSGVIRILDRHEIERRPSRLDRPNVTYAGRPAGHTSTPRLNPHGYLTLIRKGHPNANPINGRIMIHRLVMSEHLGRPLYDDEIVHHKNGDRVDNRFENLELCVSRQPPGQRVNDALAWARELVERYDGQLF